MFKDARPTILIVDDEERNRSLLRAILSGTYQTLEAEQGAAALAIIDEQPVDLVLLDVMMPGENGFAVCRRLKSREREREGGLPLPVILVSALSDQAHRNEGLAAGADDFLSKPIHRRELLLRVRAFLATREQQLVYRHKLEELSALQAAKDDLVSLLVHDLRSPLTAIMAHLQLVQDQLTPGSSAAADIEQALRSSERLGEVLEEALHIRLLEEGALPVRREPTDLHALIEETIASFAAVARRKSVGIERELRGDPVANLDGKLVRRSLENLLSNAVKYTPPGRQVRIAVRRVDGHVELEIGDRGPGIPDDFKQGLFEKFGSLEAKRGSARRGIGLGLYLVRLVAEGHGGAVSVGDRPGGGAMFQLRLACVAQAATMPFRMA